MSGTVVAVPPRVARALDLLNFSLADVRDGLGPYLSIYLLLIHDWDQASIGFVMAVGGIAAIVAQTPIGALVDRTTAKRALVVAGAVLVTAAAVAMPLFAGLYSISVLQAVLGAAGRHRDRQLGFRSGVGGDHVGCCRSSVFRQTDWA